MNEINRLFVKSSSAPTVEIDPNCHSAYIRFSTQKVAKTLSQNKPNSAIMTVDLDAKGAVIGIELVGVKEFSISAIRHYLPERLKEINFERARFMPAPTFVRNRQTVLA